MKRDCTCPRSRHHHGTYLAYLNDQCRCFPCRVAWSEAKRRQRNGERYATGETWHIDRVGTVRRLHALMAIGWRHSDISPRLATALGGRSTPSELLVRTAGGTVHVRIADAVRAVYDELSETPGPSDTNRRRAKHLNWHPPIAWDDDTIDDPNAKPYASAPVDIDEIAVEQACNGRRVHLTRAERLAAVARLTGRGYSEKQISELLGRPARSVARDKAALRGQDAA